MSPDLIKWLNEVSTHEYIWYIKRLSGNDTLANGTHQAGPYIPKEFLFKIFPDLHQQTKKNPDVFFDLFIDSHNDNKKVRAVWYNSKFFGGTRNETRLTGFGGMSSALLDPDNTGALTVFAFQLDKNGKALECHTWVCANYLEEDLIEEKIGPLEPGKGEIFIPEVIDRQNIFAEQQKSDLSSYFKIRPEQIPNDWLTTFPSGSQIIQKTIELSPKFRSLKPDFRLIKRRGFEFELFKHIEQAIELPKIRSGFDNIDNFLSLAQTVLQRRKARSGRSLELHVRAIFLEENLVENVNFSYQPESEPDKQPDFIFPSQAAYKNLSFSQDKLRMLAVKTTLRDRWRQILEEANRVKYKHLITLQEGISDNQFRDIREAGVRLVVPEPLIPTYAKHIRPHLQNFMSFIDEVKLLSDM